MKSNFVRLGDYIEQTDIRNTDLSVDLLLGVSIEKKFIPSIANTIGTDFSNYKVIKKNQFAYGPVTSRNGDKISIALLNDAEKCIISSSYISFEIIKKEEINSEYLMLLFSSSEFDRYARYNSWGSAREVISWEDFCNIKINLPTIEEQKKIIKLYKTINKRINVLAEINNVLEKTAFILFNDKTCNTICHKKKLKELGEVVTGKTPSMSIEKYYNSNDIPFIKTPDMHEDIFVTKYECYMSKDGANSQKNKYLPPNTVIMSCIGSTGAGEISLTSEISQTNQQINAIKSDYPFFIYCSLKNEKNKILTLGDGSTTMVNINKTDFENFEINTLEEEKMRCLNEQLERIFTKILQNTLEKQKLIQISKHIIDLF